MDEKELKLKLTLKLMILLLLILMPMLAVYCFYVKGSSSVMFRDREITLLLFPV